jgi:hypothetical protein
MGLLFNAALAVIGAITVVITVPKHDPSTTRSTA